MYAVKGNGVGQPVSFQRVGINAALPSGFDFIVDFHPAGYVLAEDGLSLRLPTQAEIDASGCKGARDAIDMAAGEARQAFVSPGALVDQEYRDAQAQAQAYMDAGYTGTVPPMVQSWADASCMTAQQAADDMLSTALQWTQAMQSIRAVRLAGKAAVDAAPAGADYMAVAQPYIDQLAAIRP